MYQRLLSNLDFWIFIVFALFPAFYPELSLAGDNTAVGDMLCTVSGWALGNTGKGIATLSIVMLGILALLNKMSWNFAILHIVGIALLEGAAGVVDAINAGGTGCL
ncbi:MAG: TrbC/VirB2 family protein [Pseudomonadota bacterium]